MNMITEAFPAFLMIGGIFCILSAGCIVADHILPHIESLNQFFSTLPMSQR